MAACIVSIPFIKNKYSHPLQLLYPTRNREQKNAMSNRASVPTKYWLDIFRYRTIGLCRRRPPTEQPLKQTDIRPASGRTFPNIFSAEHNYAKKNTARTTVFIANKRKYNYIRTTNTTNPKLQILAFFNHCTAYDLIIPVPYYRMRRLHVCRVAPRFSKQTTYLTLKPNFMKVKFTPPITGGNLLLF